MISLSPAQEAQLKEKYGSGPYPPITASLGGVPTTSLDVPIDAVFLALFMCAAAGHMTIFQINKRRGHKFILSGMMFGFCMARIVTMVMRIVWANFPDNIHIAIAAQIFVVAGVILLFAVNLVFAQRMLRAAHPHFGWHKSVSWSLKVLYGSIVVFLAAIITVTVQSFYTLNANTKRIDRDIQLAIQTYWAFLSFLPVPMVVFGLLIPRTARLEKFGTGRWRSKARILIPAALLLCLGASYRVGTNFKTPRPRTDSPWYFSKACFYIFNFVVEILVIYLYLIIRVDKRFHIPDGAKGPGDYSGRNLTKQVSDPGSRPRLHWRVNTEEEMVGEDMPPEPEKRDIETGVNSGSS